MSKLCLKKDKEFDLKDVITDVRISESGEIGLTLISKHSYGVILDSSGEIIGKVRATSIMQGMTYCCEKFGFIDSDGYVFILNKEGEQITRFKTNSKFGSVISMDEDGVLVCDMGCGFFDFDGRKKWEIDEGYIDVPPTKIEDYWYIADGLKSRIIITKDNGKIVESLKLDESPVAIDACATRLAVATYHKFYLFDVSKPVHPIEKKRWEIQQSRKSNIAFDPQCNLLALTIGSYLYIYDLGGIVASTRKFNDKISGIDWKGKIVLSLLKKGKIITLQQKNISMSFLLSH